MTVQLTRFSNISLPFVGEEKDAQNTFLFCNGIMNEPHTAREGAQIVSNAFGGRQVFIFHNPTGLADYFSSSPEQVDSQIGLIASLASKIKEFISFTRERDFAEETIRIYLFVHSHGAVLAKGALEALEQTNREKVRVYSFGGATLIPNNLACKVVHYVFQEDLIAEVGNLHSDTRFILSGLKEIQAKQNGGMRRHAAIGELALRDLKTELNPILSTMRGADPQTIQEKRERYEQIFTHNNAQALQTDPFFLTRCQEYRSWLQDYNVIFLNGRPFQHPEYSPMISGNTWGESVRNVPWNLGLILGNAVKGSLAIGTHAVRNHLFSAYQGAVQQIAQEEEL